jgi:hypothetical protein
MRDVCTSANSLHSSHRIGFAFAMWPTLATMS